MNEPWRIEMSCCKSRVALQWHIIDVAPIILGDATLVRNVSMDICESI